MPKSITFGKIVFSFLYSPFKLINPISKKRIHQDISNFLKSHQNMKDDIEYVYLTEKDRPISLFKVFLNNKKFFISPIAPIISLFISILILFCRRNSNLNFYLIKYLQMNNSIKI